ncbi:hypothetical protein [Fischerella sp. PCC 9605]|uniref:hypothetical protein n=1 Tax=Fischerella sp. PCC 9605 TaxID=1173024 RepID=UPI00047B0D87|nr:hypothetical protein [Fischerella sp. PCC 9605]
MTENKALIQNADMGDLTDSSSVNADEKQIVALRTLLKLPPEERNALLAKQAATIAEYFVPGSEEMEWAEEYVEDENWDDE